MPTTAQVKAALHLGEVDLDELIDLLTVHFGGARMDAPREIVFPTNGSASLRLMFSRDLHRIEHIDAAADISPASLTELRVKIEQELLLSTGRRYGTAVLFALQPVTGWWRYQDRLQIRPVPAEAPRPPFTYAANPLILDFPFAGTTDSMTAVRRRERASTRWAHRLNLLVEPGVELSSSIGGTHHWVLVQRNGGQLRSEYLQGGYLADGMTYGDQVLPAPEGDPIQLVEPEPYYISLL